MYTGTLNEVILDQTSKFLIESTEEEFCSLLEEDTPTSPSNNPDAIKHFLANVKRICLTKPKNWLKSMIQKLNHLALRINVYEETKPGERSIWSKIKASISSVILSLTHRLNSILGNGDRDHYTNKIASSDDAEGQISGMKDYISNIKDTKRKTMHKLINKNFDTLMKAQENNDLHKFSKVDGVKKLSRSYDLVTKLERKYRK